MTNTKNNFSKQTIGFVMVGISFGLSLGLAFSAFANKDISEKGLPVMEINRFASALNRVKDVYVDEVGDKKLITSAISGMLSNLDPHSSYLDENAFREMTVDTRGEFGGLGIEVQMENGLIKVMSPMEDTPAWRAGIKTGDLIFLIDKKPIQGLSLNEAVSKMRGKPGTSVLLSIRRPKVQAPVEITLVREIIKVRSVKAKRLPNDIGFIRITNFQENTVPLLVEQIIKLYETAPLKSLVLDLRNDPGGLLSTAIAVSGIFVGDNQTIVTTNGRSADSKKSYNSNNSNFTRYVPSGKKFPIDEIKKVPMVVLINNGSASASEIVAGALQDYNRAKIMGLLSFGKASVQTIIPLEDQKTAIKITTARYYTPKGRSIQVTGIVPDLWVAETEDGNTREQLREEDYPGHLDGFKDEKKDETPVASTPSSIPKLPEFGSDEDWMLKQAINFLTNKPVATIPPKKAKTIEEAKSKEAQEEK